MHRQKTVPKKKRILTRRLPMWLCIVVCCALALVFLLALPFLLSRPVPTPGLQAPFPVSVNPHTKTILENTDLAAYFGEDATAVENIVASVSNGLEIAAAAIVSSSFYPHLPWEETRLVALQPGYRKEEVASALSNALGWDEMQEKKFLESTKQFEPSISEGRFAPGMYTIKRSAGSKTVREHIRDKFDQEIASRYASSTEVYLSLEDALTIASIIQRETSNKKEMRVISGIIWNRLFENMNLQMDATLQYIKGSEETGWWPVVRSDDKYLDSPYNTYQNPGLPPSPIASPGVAAVIAALNPKKTPCMFYLHDRRGGFHCSLTYKDHVALIKKYYGRR